MDTPVLLLTYNRPDETLKVLSRLEECGVTQVFVSGDGPKNESDQVKTDEVRSTVIQFQRIVTEVQFSPQNMGCKKAVIHGINWFFDQVAEGIILEDDCLPTTHFFSFTESLLERYRNHRKVWMISGNLRLGNWESEGGHFFSRIGHIWGWATWRDRWDDFRPELPFLEEFIDNSGFEKAFGPTHLAKSRKELTLLAKEGEIDTWDYQWMAQILMENGLAALPSQNLIENIGLNTSGTNTPVKPDWLVNNTAVNPITIAERAITIDREYEMEYSLCQHSNSAANHSLFYHTERGKDCRTNLKVVLLNSSDLGGGAERVVMNMHLELLKRGHESVLLVQHKKTSIDTVVELSDKPTEQIKQLAPDILHVHNLHGTNLSLTDLSKLSNRIATVITLHDSWVTTGSNNHPFQLYGSRLSLLEIRAWKDVLRKRNESLNRSRIRLVAPSQWMRERSTRTLQIKTHFVSNGLSETEPKSVQAPSDRFVLFVANKAETNPYKDFETLFTAWTEANKELGPNAVDLICISGKPKQERIGNGQLIILPKTENNEVLALMQQSLFVVQATKEDNSPMTILESHSIGKPVLAPIVGGIPEMLSTNELDYSYIVGDTQDLKQQLIRLMEDHGKEKFTSFRAQSFSAAQMVDAYLGHYLELINA